MREEIIKNNKNNKKRNDFNSKIALFKLIKLKNNIININ